MKAKHVLLTISFLFMLTCIYAGLKGIYKYREYKKRDEIALSNLASNLNVDADWSVIQNEIYCKKIPFGITLDEIRQELSDITPIDIVRTDDVYLYYDLYFLDFDVRLNDMALAFDSENKLKEKLLWTGLGETMPVECS
ncbi:MAG: hypothetical protein H7Y59_00865 [Anaerolineales bacterium]|nr:hypothetical protein [Anaerolineales bacterium]